MKYDDASWHYGRDFPRDLPNEAGATYIGMFVVWALLEGLGGEVHIEEPPEHLSKLTGRTMTPGEFFIETCDEKFVDEDLSDEGNLFAKHYFDLEGGDYIGDYESCLGGKLPTLYHIADTWENFDKLRPILERRLQEWREAYRA